MTLVKLCLKPSAQGAPCTHLTLILKTIIITKKNQLFFISTTAIMTSQWQLYSKSYIGTIANALKRE